MRMLTLYNVHTSTILGILCLSYTRHSCLYARFRGSRQMSLTGHNNSFNMFKNRNKTNRQHQTGIAFKTLIILL